MTRAGFLARASVGALTVFVVAEALLGLADDALPEPVEWYNATAQAKAVQMEAGAKRGARKDVVFIGPSTVYRGVDAQLFERADSADRSAYNAGVKGGFPPIMLRWVMEEVVPRLRPRTVVYGLSSLDFHDRIFRGSVEAYQTARATRRDIWGTGERLLARLSRVVKYRKLLQDPSEYTYVRRVLTGRERDRVERELRELSPGGFQPKEPVPLEERRPVDRAILRGFDVGQRGTDHVKATVARLRSHRVRIVFVEMPVPPRFVSLHPDGRADYQRFRRHLRRLATDLKVELLSPPRRLSEGDLFADYVHYNARGAREFTRWLARSLPVR
jgi:hypothetical protein